jgi:hypothetical protein
VDPIQAWVDTFESSAANIGILAGKRGNRGAE